MSNDKITLPVELAMEPEGTINSGQKTRFSEKFRSGILVVMGAAALAATAPNANADVAQDTFLTLGGDSATYVMCNPDTNKADFVFADEGQVNTDFELSEAGLASLSTDYSGLNDVLNKICESPNLEHYLHEAIGHDSQLTERVEYAAEYTIDDNGVGSINVTLGGDSVMELDNIQKYDDADRYSKTLETNFKEFVKKKADQMDEIDFDGPAKQVIKDVLEKGIAIVPDGSAINEINPENNFLIDGLSTERMGEGVADSAKKVSKANKKSPKV